MAVKFMTFGEVAEYLRLKKQTLYSLAQKGNIPAYKFGRQWRFKTSRLEQWIEEQEISKKRKNKDKRFSGEK